ncbi:hypothetical protein [Streptomyces nitrosporeus]|uniref:hypothetical protein n=1 Tax=Streptomyces nitrosporeus TaxID=28894 RepID=UPI00331A759B
MEPISAALLVALATGTAGEAGRHLWLTLSGLVRRSRGRDAEEGGPPALAAAEDELDALVSAPHDEERARRLSEALGRRARSEPAFGAGLAQWHQQAQALRTGDGETRNDISGGTQNGPVLQGRDFSGIHFGTPDGPPPAR